MSYLLHRWVFLRTRLDRELDQGQEQNQPHDEPAPPDHAAHAQQISEDGDRAVEVQPVDSSSFLDCLPESRLTGT